MDLSCKMVGGSVDYPRIVFCGLPRSGKTSISKVVFQKMPPHETLFLESTHKVDLRQIKRHPMLHFSLYDCPGSAIFPDEQQMDLLSKCGAMIFVIDAQDEPYTEVLQHAKRLILRVYERNPKMFFEIFIHKVDGDLFMSDEHKTECQTDIHTRLTDELYQTPDLCLAFHCTSIYDHSVFEAMSKVVQKLIPELPVLEQLLDLLVTNCRIEKGYLFDVVSKIYIATDSGNIDGGFYELCSDMIDVVIDISCIYGGSPEEDATFMSHSSCVIQLNNGYLLYLKQVESFLAFACLIREENFDRQYLLDYNINVFKESLLLLRQSSSALATSPPQALRTG